MWLLAGWASSLSEGPAEALAASLSARLLPQRMLVLGESVWGMTAVSHDVQRGVSSAWSGEPISGGFETLLSLG